MTSTSVAKTCLISSPQCLSGCYCDVYCCRDISLPSALPKEGTWLIYQQSGGQGFDLMVEKVCCADAPGASQLWQLMARPVLCFLQIAVCHRQPEFSHGDRSCWWELTCLGAHVHPSVEAFAKTLLAGTYISYDGDPLRDLTLTAFLDKFVQRKAKVWPALCKASAMQNSPDF